MGLRAYPRRVLALEDIEDLRAYERGRAAYRQQIIALKRRRRVALGSIVSMVFENRETVRSQIQEMARAEHMISDEQIQTELDIYNPLIPQPGELSATLFIELTGEEALRNWLPRLVGIERAVVLRVGDDAGGPGGRGVVRAQPEAAHEMALTRGEVTASVHYLRFALTEDQVARFAAGPAVLAVEHDQYEARTELVTDVRAELLTDLRPDLSGDPGVDLGG
jgi:hypothetical protein